MADTTADMETIAAALLIALRNLCGGDMTLCVAGNGSNGLIEAIPQMIDLIQDKTLAASIQIEELKHQRDEALERAKYSDSMVDECHEIIQRMNHQAVITKRYMIKIEKQVADLRAAIPSST